MLLVLLLDAAQDRDRVLDGGLGHEDRLEAPGERRVLLHVLAVLVERGGADAVQLAAGERGLQEVRGVHGPVRLAGADERVHLVDEQDDAALGRLHLGEHALQALLELAAVLRARDQRAHVEGEEGLVAQRFRHVAVDDPQRQPLHDGGLADPGLADQHGVVLGAPGQDLDRAADLLVAPDHGVELALARRLGEVAGVLLQRVVGVLRAGVVGRAALAERVDGRVQRGGGDARGGERAARLGVLLHGEREEKALHGHVGIARLLGGLLGGVEQAHELARRLRGRRVARDLGLLGHPGLGLGERHAGLPAGTVDQARAQALGVVEEDLEQVAGLELGVSLAHREVLRRLHEAAGALGVLLEIHIRPPSDLTPSERRARTEEDCSAVFAD
ncbi:hypothetical protein LDDCCGHA_6019 [Methylobacterium oxalidis]|nr:hypothetical protein LDDCCGHA_6019 [Methylobacterium oxalidis]